MSEMMPAIVVLAHKRLDHLDKTLAALKQARGFDRYRLIVVVDGADPKVVGLAESRAAPDFILSIRDRAFMAPEARINAALRSALGLAFDGLSASHVVVVEDDIVVSRDFLSFVEQSHRQFSRNKHYRGVNGFSAVTLPPGISRPSAQVVKLNYGLGWGWSITAPIYRKIVHYWPPQREKLDWDVAVEPFIRTGFVINPIVSRIRNIGFDSSAVHTNGEPSRELGRKIDRSFSQNDESAESLQIPLSISKVPFSWRRDCVNIVLLEPVGRLIFIWANRMDALAYQIQLSDNALVRHFAGKVRTFLRESVLERFFFKAQYVGRL